MQATYKLQRSSGGMLGATLVFVVALILGGAGGYVLKASVSTTTIRSNPPAITAPSTQVNTDPSGSEARRHFRLAN